MKIYLFLIVLLVGACLNDPASSRPIAQETHLENNEMDIVEAVNRNGFQQYRQSSSESFINPLDAFASTSISSRRFKGLQNEIEAVSLSVGNSRNKWTGSFLTDEQMTSSNLFLGADYSIKGEFSKVWSERYHKTDTYEFMEIQYADSRIVADIIFPQDDFDNFIGQFSYEKFQKALKAAKPIRAKVFVPVFEQGEVNKVSLKSRGTDGHSIECGPFPEVLLHRPFVFVVRDPKTSVILFIGNVTHI